MIESGDRGKTYLFHFYFFKKRQVAASLQFQLEKEKKKDHTHNHWCVPYKTENENWLSIRHQLSIYKLVYSTILFTLCTCTHLLHMFDFLGLQTETTINNTFFSFFILNFFERETNQHYQYGWHECVRLKDLWRTNTYQFYLFILFLMIVIVRCKWY